ncbi:MAG: HupE/UreJ family protein [Cyanobacteria bacterium J06559_3]
MRQRQRFPLFITCAVFFVILCGVLSNAAWAHEGDITLTELREQSGAEYTLRVDLPNELAGSTLTPQLPDRCTLTPDTPPTPATGTVQQFAFTCNGQPLADDDTLNLPWPTEGGIVAVYWQDGSSQSQFFTAGDDGVAVPLQDFQAKDTSWIPQLRQDAIAGFVHSFLAWPHLLFLAALAFWTRAQRLVHFMTAFMLGSMLAAAIASISGVTVPLLAAELPLVVFAAVLALLGTRKQSGSDSVWSLLPLSILGLLHGLGWAGVLSQGGATSVQRGVRLLVFNLGVDAAHLLGVLAILGLLALGRRLPQTTRWRPIVGYSLGVLAVAAIALPQTYLPPTTAEIAANPPAAETGSDNEPAIAASNEPATPTVVEVETANNTAIESQPTADEPLVIGEPEGSGAEPIEGFVAINPFEIRTEILLDVPTVLASDLIETLPDTPTLAVEDQEAFKQTIAQATTDGFQLTVEGTPADLTLDQVNFVTVGTAGIVLREDPIPEALDEATLGIVLLSPVNAIPQDVTVEWTVFSPTIPRIATTITDPQRSTEQVLTAEQPTARWENTLVNVAVPDIQAIDVSATRRAIPLVSLALVLVALWLDKRGWPFQRDSPKDRLRPRPFFAVTRTILPLAIWAYPLAALPLALPPPFQAKPSSTQTALILEQLLSNVYQSFEFRTEEEIYDNLAVSVEGEQLADIYLENRRALEVENRGGARARVDQVDVTEISSIHSAPGKELLVQAEWRVGGSVSHFGHTHYRHNLYVAAVTLSYVDSVWKIKRIDVIDEHRLL